MSLYDDILKHMHRVDQKANDLAADMVRELGAVRERLLGKLATVAEALDTDWQNATLKKRKRFLKEQARQVDLVLADLYGKEFPGMIQNAGADVVEATLLVTSRSGQEVLGKARLSITPTLNKRTVSLWFESSTVDGLLINDWLAKLQKAARDRILSASRQALIEGMGIDAAARHMRKVGIEGSVPGLRGLARTTMMSAANHARETIFEEGFSDVITGYLHVATLDRRSCVRCGALDGEFYAKGQPKPSLPLHWSCRCIYLPDTKAKHDLPDRAAVKHSTRLVRHHDGSTSTAFQVEAVDFVPGKTTYQQWLKRQLKEDPAFVRAVLGKTRYELFKSGKLTLDQMVTNGRIKKLSELR